MKKLLIILAFLLLPFISSGQAMGHLDGALWAVSYTFPEYNDLADSLFVRMDSQPNDDKKSIISDKFDKYEYFNIIQNLDALYMPAHTQQANALNWAQDTFDLVLVNSPTFTIDLGFTGNGSSMYINTKWDALTDAVYFSKSASCIGFRKYEDVTDVALSMGARNSVSGYSTNITGGDIAGRLIGRIDGNQLVTNGLSAESGLFAVAARPSDHFNYYNGVMVTTDASPSYLPYETLDFFLLNYNLNGLPGATNYASHTMNYSFIGGFYDEKRMAATFNISEQYLYDINTLTKEDSTVIYCEGNSLTQGTANNPGEAYPTLLSDSNSTWKVTNGGNDGYELTDMLNTVFTANGVERQYDVTNKNEIVVVWGGTNDIYKDSSSIGTHVLMDSLCTELQMWGYKVIVMTTLPTTRLSVGGATVTDTIVNYNTLIKDNYTSYADGIVKLDEDSRLSNPLNTTYFTFDEIHLIEAGYSVVQELLQPKINSTLE